MNKPSYDLDRVLELMLAFVLLAGLLGLIAGIVGVFNAVAVSTVAGIGVFVYAKWAPRRSVPGLEKPSIQHLVVILLVAALFRFSPYYYVQGGQDQGVYVNMAAELVRTGDIAPEDSMLKKLDEPGLVAKYVERNYEAFIYVPGVYRGEGSPPASIEFQFYHLFPVWMAIVGGMFGLKASVYALTFLSLLSVLFFYRLALALTASRKAAVVAGFLLAVNPLHAFFSKFPVTEVPTLLLSSAAFSFLAMYWHAPEQQRLRRWLVLAALSMACLFATRISGFMYLPFLLGMSVIALVADEDRQRARAISGWVVATVLIYAASVLYGLSWSGKYSSQIYEVSFARVLGANWQKPLMWIVAACLIAWMLTWLVPQSVKVQLVLRRVMVAGQSWLGVAMLAVLLLSLYKLYQLGFTDRYVDDAWIGKRWNLAGHEWRSAQSVSMVVSAMYLSPFVLLAAFAMSLKRWENPLLSMLLLFLLPFSAMIAVLQWNVPYQPYYARYLLSEFVPYLLLFVVCGWAYLENGAAKKMAGACLAIGAVWMIGLSCLQIGKNENAGAAEALSSLVEGIDQGDLVLMDSDNVRGFSPAEVRTALLYSFGTNVMLIDSGSLSQPELVGSLDSKFDDIYLISSSPYPPDRFRDERSVRYRVSAFVQNQLPPMETFDRSNAQIFLYRMERPTATLELGKPVLFSTAGLGAGWLEKGWSSTENWGVWSQGDAASVRLAGIADSGAKEGRSMLRFDLRAFVSSAQPVQRVGISIENGKPEWMTFRYPDLTSQSVDVAVPKEALLKGQRLSIEFQLPDAVSPKSLGLSADPRILGVGLESVELQHKDDESP